MSDALISLLRRTPVLGLLEEGALRVLASVADQRRMTAGEVLFRQGDRSDGGYVVISGSVAVGRSDNDGDGTILRSGSLVGQAALFARMQRPASAVAREAAELLRISPTLMRRVLSEFPASAASVRDALARDLGGLSDELNRIADQMGGVAPP